jgi:hypothetical protein
MRANGFLLHRRAGSASRLPEFNMVDRLLAFSHLGIPTDRQSSSSDASDGRPLSRNSDCSPRWQVSDLIAF